jgi:cytochrome P450
VDELIDGMERQRDGGDVVVDLAAAFSLPLAFKVIYEMLGIPFEVGRGRGGHAIQRPSRVPLAGSVS